MDLISSLLRTFHLNATVFERSRFCGNWSLEHATRNQASFHLLASGGCWLDRLDGSPPLHLHEGDLLVLPRDAPHRLANDPGFGAPAPERAPLSDGAAGGTGIVCGYFVFDGGASNPVLDALPEYLLLRVDQVAERCGYGTEAGFSKAFKRRFGYGPGAVRRGGYAAST